MSNEVESSPEQLGGVYSEQINFLLEGDHDTDPVLDPAKETIMPLNKITNPGAVPVIKETIEKEGLGVFEQAYLVVAFDTLHTQLDWNRLSRWAPGIAAGSERLEHVKEASERKSASENTFDANIEWFLAGLEGKEPGFNKERFDQQMGNLYEEQREYYEREQACFEARSIQEQLISLTAHQQRLKDFLTRQPSDLVDLARKTFIKYDPKGYKFIKDKSEE